MSDRVCVKLYGVTRYVRRYSLTGYVRLYGVTCLVLCAYREQVAALGGSALGGLAPGDIIVEYEYCIICKLNLKLCRGSSRF